MHSTNVQKTCYIITAYKVPIYRTFGVAPLLIPAPRNGFEVNKEKISRKGEFELVLVDEFGDDICQLMFFLRISKRIFWSRDTEPPDHVA